MYETGRGVEQSDTKAVQWYHKAAERGDTLAQRFLGLMYVAGRGVEQSDTKAVQWYRKAAEQGDAMAQRLVGDKYKTGRGVEQSDTKAVQWIRKAAEQGDAVAQRSLVEMHLSSHGVEQSDAKAVQWYRKKADQGHALAQLKVLTPKLNCSYALLALVLLSIIWLYRRQLCDAGMAMLAFCSDYAQTRRESCTARLGKQLVEEEGQSKLTKAHAKKERMARKKHRSKSKSLAVESQDSPRSAKIKAPTSQSSHATAGTGNESASFDLSPQLWSTAHHAIDAEEICTAIEVQAVAQGASDRSHKGTSQMSVNGPAKSLLLNDLQAIGTSKVVNNKTKVIIKHFQKANRKLEYTEVDDSDACVICLNEAKTHVITPCGHQCLCGSCALKLNVRSACCPVCRNQTDAIFRVYK